MNAAEYNKLADVENRHWFYVGKRDIVRHWIQTVRPLSPNDLLADCGAGTGTFAAEMSQHCRVLALDDHQESLELARTKLGPDQVREGPCTHLPLADKSVDVITALDVLEHVQDDKAAIREFHRVLRSDGIVVITVPALPALWSDWDVVLHHYRRYKKNTLLEVIPSHLFEIVHFNYINVAVLPLVYIVRKFRALKLALGLRSRSRSEDSIPPAWINSILRKTFTSLACQRSINFPAGVGIIAVLRKK